MHTVFPFSKTNILYKKTDCIHIEQSNSGGKIQRGNQCLALIVVMTAMVLNGIWLLLCFPWGQYFSSIVNGAIVVKLNFILMIQSDAAVGLLN